ncbi:MAG: NAD+ synthase [Dehalococcoidia bacterium]|nr:NAD+ synthase [Dehalococcoidia bacterium]
MRSCRIALAQLNTTVGDIEGNCMRIRDAIAAARDVGAGIVAFPELAVTGYPPEDLLLRRSFCEKSRSATAALASATNGIVAVVGFVDWTAGDPYNAAAVFAEGTWAGTYHKRRLPNYGVFDEERYFASGRKVPVFKAGDLTFGVSICEDIWFPGQPLTSMALGGAELCININASPYHRGRGEDRARMLATRAIDNRMAIAYVNAVGGQDELVFDGSSMALDAHGEVIANGPQFRDDLVILDVEFDEAAQSRLHDPRRRAALRHGDSLEEVEQVDLEIDLDLNSPKKPSRPKVIPLADEAEVWEALVLGTRDYLAKTGFEKAYIGLSGGIDSSVVAAVAVDALGPENVVGVSMPSRYSSDHSRSDALELAENLGIELLTIPIEPAHAAMLKMLAGPFADSESGLAEENLQSRQRGNILMSLANKFGALVLTTGNKSEMATGYATLYGDMAGGFAVLKDVPKTLTYAIASWRNAAAKGSLIPQNVIEKPASAELRPDQRDTDSLPPYEVLDPILEAYVEGDRTGPEIVALGFDEATVRSVIALVDRNEYKRRQSPPGVKITPRAFGRDRRLPIANRFTDW